MRPVRSPGGALLGLLLAGAAALRADDGGQAWPQWRGPDRDGRVLGPVWPDRLDERSLRARWSVPLEPGYSGPIVVGNRVFVTETAGEKLERVTALDRRDGSRLWAVEWEGAISVPFFAKRNGDWIRSTPAWDSGRLYVAGMRDVLVCLEATDGREAWRVDFVEAFGAPLPAFGFVASPLVDGDGVYVQAGAAVVRLNKHDGTVVWRSLEDSGGMWGSAFSSPIVATLGGVRQLVVLTRAELAGLTLDSGEVLWRQVVPAFRGMNILTPVVHGDLVFTSTYGGRTPGFRVTREDGGFKVEEAWVHRSQGYMSTPVVIGDHAYHHLRSQRIVCVDLRTGEERWTSPRSFGTYWSLVAQGDRILALDQQGELHLLRANPGRFELLDSRRVSESETWAHLAVAGNELFIRALDGLRVYEFAEAGPVAMRFKEGTP